MNYLDLTEFRDSGLLQEVNRQFFHPRGLALEVVVDKATGKATKLGQIQDFRDDPEGVWMTLSEADVERGKTLNEDFQKRIHERVRFLGWVIQPLQVQDKTHPNT